MVLYILDTNVDAIMSIFCYIINIVKEYSKRGLVHTI